MSKLDIGCQVSFVIMDMKERKSDGNNNINIRKY